MNDSIFDIDMYDVVLYKPYTYHRAISSEFTRTCIYFSDDFLEQYFTKKTIKPLLQCFDKKIISLNKDDFMRAKHLLLLLEKEDINNFQNDIFIYLFEILGILKNVNKVAEENILSQSYRKLVPILAYINTNYSKIDGIEEIADSVNFTKYYLCHLFKKQTGLTVTQYLNEIKIKYACDALENTNKTITEIGTLCGYNSTMYFCKKFKEITRLTPHEYKKVKKSKK